MSRKKNCINHHHQEVNLRVEDQVYLQATSLKGTQHFHDKETHTKIHRPSSRSLQDLTTPSEITMRRREDSYQLELPPDLPNVHNIFHASQPYKCFELPDKPDLCKSTDRQATDLQPNLAYARNPLAIWIKQDIIHEATPSSTSRFSGAPNGSRSNMRM